MVVKQIRSLFEVDSPDCGTIDYCNTPSQSNIWLHVSKRIERFELLCILVEIFVSPILPTILPSGVATIRCLYSHPVLHRSTSRLTIPLRENHAINKMSDTFSYPEFYSFPPFFTIQVCRSGCMDYSNQNLPEGGIDKNQTTGAVETTHSAIPHSQSHQSVTHSRLSTMEKSRD